MEWSPESWKKKQSLQQPSYKDQALLGQIKSQIALWPGLVYSNEIDQLKSQLRAVEAGESFILQGGDCAERFQDCTPEIITSKLRILLQMSLILGWGLRKSIVKIGRIAGQYGKPRSQMFEMSEGKEIPVYRGDAVNGYLACLSERDHDPSRLALAYQHSSMTLNFIRSLTGSGFADLHNREAWDIGFENNNPIVKAYSQTISQIRSAIGFMESMGISSKDLSKPDFYTSHEGLLLDYEEALTRRSSGSWYDFSAHMLWIGERTRQIDGAHVEFFRGVANPIGVKVGPESRGEDLSALLDILNPHNESGKIILVSRFGKDRIGELQPIVSRMKAEGRRLIWSADPMHGNSFVSANGKKTREFSSILSELKQTSEIQTSEKHHLGGVQFELTADPVTECVGGVASIDHSD
jgi:3-deoxy-7-phosphoheptulonate synthase